MRGTGQLSMQSAEQTKVVLHLGGAIDALTRNQDAQAAEELDRVLEAGFSHPSLYLLLGLLRSKGDRLESAQRHLQHAVKHNDYSLAASILQGQVFSRKGQFKEASLEYLEALRLADALMAPPDQADEVRQLYEPLIETQQNQTDDEACRRLCENVNGLLARPDWREQLHKSREQMPKQEGGIVPIAEVLLQTQSSQVLETINRVHQLARAGFLRPAMAEAFDAVQHAPTYLPLHTLIGDLLIQEGRPQEAIAKFSVVAHAYSVRGEAAQSTKLLRRIIQLAPMDLSARTRLIDQLVARGMVDDAINEYLELADIYYRLAELDMARKTYTTALRVVQQSNADRAWNVHILQRMADIDMQRLNWKQALRIFEQIRTLRPDDASVRKNLVDLNLRMGQEQQALTEVEGYITYLESRRQTAQIVQFLEELVAEHGDQSLLQRALAEQLHRAGRTSDAVAQLDILGDTFLTTGRKREAAEIIQKIILMNPPNVEDYRQVLAQIQQDDD
jgi:tetratricopeptide (TPR) repeat protein